jgi:prevent-host-death family protein
MTVMTALDAKNAFGQFLDAVQRGPVTVTKNGREVGAMFSKADLEAIGEACLWPPLKDEVSRGDLSVAEALRKQAILSKRIEESEADIAAGRTVVADEAFYEELRAEIRAVAARRA